MDFLDSTWTEFGGGDRQDPREQIRIGIEYMRARYGNPDQDFWDAHRRYSEGGGWYKQPDDDGED